MSMRLVNFTLSLMLGFILTYMFPATNVASAMSFDKWLSNVEISARAEGLSEETIKNLTGLKMDPEILALAARQPEYVKLRHGNISIPWYRTHDSIRGWLCLPPIKLFLTS